MEGRSAPPDRAHGPRPATLVTGGAEHGDPDRGSWWSRSTDEQHDVIHGHIRHYPRKTLFGKHLFKPDGFALVIKVDEVSMLAHRAAQKVQSAMNLGGGLWVSSTESCHNLIAREANNTVSAR